VQSRLASLSDVIARVRSAASIVAVVATREGGRHHPDTSATRRAGERFGAEAGAINSRQLSAGFADNPASAREGVADYPVGDRSEPCGQEWEMRRDRSASPTPARGTTRASCRGECVR